MNVQEKSPVCCTFSGRLCAGDILWSLPTVRALAQRYGTPLDFFCMPQYETLLPLLSCQSYIAKAGVIFGWRLEGSPHGDLPIVPQDWPEEVNYTNVHHLTYRYHPVEPLVVHIAQAQGVQLPPNPLPFIEVPASAHLHRRRELAVAYAFNEMYPQEKHQFLTWFRPAVAERVGAAIRFVDVTVLSWLAAAAEIQRACCFVGCRSSNYVLAHGVGQRVLVYEPNTSRRPATFGCPFGDEVMPEVADAEAFVRTAAEWVTDAKEA